MAISCEQPKCQRSERDLNNEEEIQYFCTECDMELFLLIPLILVSNLYLCNHIFF